MAISNELTCYHSSEKMCRYLSQNEWLLMLRTDNAGYFNWAAEFESLGIWKSTLDYPSVDGLTLFLYRLNEAILGPSKIRNYSWSRWA